MKHTTASLIVILLSGIAFSAARPPLSPDAMLPSPTVEEIASWLPEAPAADVPPASDRAYWGARGDQNPKAKARAIRLGLKCLKAPVPPVSDERYLDFTTNGNRTRYQNARSKLLGGLRMLVEAEKYEGKGRFAAKAVEYLEAIASMRSWVYPAHDKELTNFKGTFLTIDLVSSALARELAETLLALKGFVPAETEARVRAEMERRVFSLYRDDVETVTAGKRLKRDRWFDGRNNWNSVCHSETVRAGLLAIADRMDRARFIKGALMGLPYFLNGFTPDGYCSEGMGYWNYGFGHYIDLGLALRKATGGRLDLFGAPRAKAAMRYAFTCHIQRGVSPRFADGSSNPDDASLKKGAQIWPDMAPLMTQPLPARTAFPDAQVFIFRTMEGTPLGLAIKGGTNNEMHNHNDIGSYCIVLDGVDMAGDPGGEIYTARTFSPRRYESKVLNSWGHPVPFVAGELQPAGAKSYAKVLGTEFTAACDTVSLDLRNAYPQVSALESLVRTASFRRNARQIVIRDEVRFSSPSSFSVPFVTVGSAKQGADKGECVITAGEPARTLRLKIEASADWKLESEDIDNPDRPSPKRRAVSFASPVTHAMVTFTYSVQ